MLLQIKNRERFVTQIVTMGRVTSISDLAHFFTLSSPYPPVMRRIERVNATAGPIISSFLLGKLSRKRKVKVGHVGYTNE